MNIPVYSATANPAVDSRLCRKSRSYVATLLRTGSAYQLDPDDITKGVKLFAHGLPAAGTTAIKILGGSNLLPFARTQNPLCKPPNINYSIPAVGDHRIRWANSFMAMPNEACAN